MSFVCFMHDLPFTERLKDEVKNCGFSILNSEIITFADGENLVDIKDCVRGQTVFIIGSIFTPVNDTLMQTLIMVDALKRASASKICLVAPYLGYTRQDRKVKPRQPITASLVAKLLQVAGVDYVVTVDLHSMQTEGFYSIPFDNLSMIPVAANILKSTGKYSNYLVVSPDHGGVTRARVFANILESDMAIIDKQRLKHNEVSSMKIIGNVNGRKCIIVDDLVDTGNTLLKAAKLLKDNGATSVDVFCTHPVFSSSIFPNDVIDRFYVTDTTVKGVNSNFLNVISCCDLLLTTLKAIDNDESLAYSINNYIESL